LLVSTLFPYTTLFRSHDHLFKLLESVNFDVNIDRLFAVGDVVDRGEKSLESLKLNYNDWFFSVMGNHEVMLLTGHLGYAKDWFIDRKSTRLNSSHVKS